jgi:Protein of unknown function (DUF2934)
MKTIGRKTVKGRQASAPMLAKSQDAPAASATRSHAPPSHEQIARRSYEIFLSNGGVHGRDVEHWIQAERELTGRLN